MQTDFRDRVAAAVEAIARKTSKLPKVGLVLGSGLSDVVDDLFESPGATDSIPYGEIDGFGAPSVAGHRGVLTISPEAAVLAGRFHFYEGRSMDDVVLPVATLVGLGVDTIIVTNAAGGINATYNPGDLVLIQDHINLMGTNPLIGPKDAEATARFQDMTQAYDTELLDLALAVDPELKAGVYAALTGPSYESPAEIRMLAALGADLVGMSTVPEVIVARSYGARVLGISTVTNLAAGLSGSLLDHAEVVEVGRSIRSRMVRLLKGVMASLRG